MAVSLAAERVFSQRSGRAAAILLATGSGQGWMPELSPRLPRPACPALALPRPHPKAPFPAG